MSLIYRRDPAKQYVPKGPREVIGFEKSINCSKEWFEEDKYSTWDPKVWHGVCGICIKVFKYQPIKPNHAVHFVFRYDKSKAFYRYKRHKLLTHWKELGYANFKAAKQKWKELYSGFPEPIKHELELDEIYGINHEDEEPPHDHG